MWACQLTAGPDRAPRYFYAPLSATMWGLDHATEPNAFETWYEVSPPSADDDSVIGFY